MQYQYANVLTRSMELVCFNRATRESEIKLGENAIEQNSFPKLEFSESYKFLLYQYYHILIYFYFIQFK